MKRYLGYEYNNAGNLEAAYAYSVAPEDLETIENMISYYNHHGVNNIHERHAGFVVDDLEKLLAILETVFQA